MVLQTRSCAELVCKDWKIDILLRRKPYFVRFTLLRFTSTFAIKQIDSICEPSNLGADNAVAGREKEPAANRLDTITSVTKLA